MTNEKSKDLAESILFETSWEVCNKVGGIYTVIQSKAKYFHYKFYDYFLLGPYIDENHYYEFIQEDMPEHIEKVKNDLEKEGINIYYGRWLIETTPKVILVDFKNYQHNNDYVKTKLWEWHGIDSLNSVWFDFDKPTLWAWCVGRVVELIQKQYKRNAILHTHEWMSGAAQFYIKSTNNKKISTVFTTHATTLGRAMAGSEFNNPHNEEVNFNIDEKARELGVTSKHLTEKALAHQADCFTTVSELTSRECGRFLGKEADIIVKGGFDCGNLTEGDIENEFYNSRENINKVLNALFKPYYKFNTENTHIMYTSGRYEINSKGSNLIIDALVKLNEDLKKSRQNKNLVFFFLIPLGEPKPNYEIKENLENLKLGYELNINQDNKEKLPPVTTHDIDDNVLLKKMFYEKGLDNRKENKVKVVFVPRYLDGVDEIFNLNYYKMIRGFDFGIFPSYYEPWGYTPLESIANSVPAVSSDLSGFGRYINKHFNGEETLKVIQRHNKSYEESRDQLYKVMKNQIKISKRRQLISKLQAKKFSENFSWEKLSFDYTSAYLKSKK